MMVYYIFIYLLTHWLLKRGHSCIIIRRECHKK